MILVFFFFYPSIVKNDQPIEIQFIALKNIKKNDELNFSYIDSNVINYQTRREMLKDYGFVCQCPRCLKEEKLEKE